MSAAGRRRYSIKAYPKTKARTKAKREAERAKRDVWCSCLRLLSDGERCHHERQRRRVTKRAADRRQWNASKERILAEQGGRCRTCGTDQPRKMQWHLDHDHVTGALRGVLCRSCNIALGILRENAATLRAMAEYVDKGER